MTESGSSRQASTLNFSQQIREGKLTARQILVIGLLGLLVLSDGMDNQVLGLIAHDLARDLAIPISSFGLVFSISLIGAIVGALFLTAAADQWLGRKKVVVFGMSLAGIGTVVTACVGTLEELMIVRFLTGVGLGAALPTAISLAAELSPQRLSRRVVTLMIAFVPLGSLLGGLMARVIIPWSNWQMLLYVVGAGTLVLTAMAALIVPESIHFLVRKKQDQRRAVSAVRKLFQVNGISAVTVDNDAVDESANDKKLVANLFKGNMWKLTLLFWLVFMMNQAILYFVINWTPALLLSSGMAATAGMDAAAMFGLGGAIGTIAQGWLTTRYGLYKVLFIEIAVYIISMLILPVTLQYPQLAPVFIFVIAATICAYHAGCILVILESYPESIKNTGFGWAFGVGRIGASGAPVIAGYLLAIGWSPAAVFLAATTPGVLSGVALLCVRFAMAQRWRNQCEVQAIA
ncbi:MFS transporter [Kineobactrum salinum]|uniref:MFS transporter n=1 Tax=Kineobactrum salinum TaxID=2708301 RepID=A0A6C0TYN7_9GAMM|nr:MFS transporter [Kineobactrum salinum]QIB64911.1 MFS transporter [Kineobactrum salinum]